MYVYSNIINPQTEYIVTFLPSKHVDAIFNRFCSKDFLTCMYHMKLQKIVNKFNKMLLERCVPNNTLINCNYSSKI